MRTSVFRLAGIAATLLAATVLSSGCAVDGYGYGYDGDVNVGVDYYEPFGIDYGGWGPGYRVGPYRGGDRGGFGHGGGRPGPHAYRPAAQGHSMPSIPGRSRGGGRSR